MTAKRAMAALVLLIGTFLLIAGTASVLVKVDGVQTQITAISPVLSTMASTASVSIILVITAVMALGLVILRFVRIFKLRG